MIGTMADILLKKKVYKERMEQFLVNIVFPEFNSPHGHLRARYVNINVAHQIQLPILKPRILNLPL